MSEEASPRPWTWDINDDDQLMLYDADGNPLGQLFDHGCESEANLIVDAVNERETLFTDMKITHAELQLKTEECEKLREIAKHICTLLEDAYDPTDPGANPNGWAVFGEELRLSLIKKIRAVIEEATK